MNRLSAALIAEALGTFLFFFVGAGSVVLAAHAGANGPGLVGIAFAHGLALAVMVSAFGAISGGHFNPAVTVAVRLAGRIEWTHAAAYVVAQLVGAAAAGYLLAIVMPDAPAKASFLGTPTLDPAISVGAGIAIEAVLTLVLIFAVFGTAVDRRAPRLGGMAIGLAVAADVLMGGPLTGAAMNPARWFGPALASGHWDNWYVWWIAPLIGAIVAAVIYRYVLEGEAEPDVTPATPEG
jgi:MIP family channel proteins